MTTKTLLPIVALTIALAGIAAGAAAGTIRYAGPVEVHVVEDVGGVNYLTIGRYSTLNAALASINDATASKPYLIFLPPGTYDLGSTGIVMKEYVSVQGSGQDVTTITCACGSTVSIFTDNSSATLVGASNMTLSNLTVENTGGDDYAVAITNEGTSPTLVNVTAIASGSGDNYGIWNYASASPTMTGVTAKATGGDLAFAIINYETSNALTMTRFTAIATGGAVRSLAIGNQDTSPAMSDITAIASGPVDNIGIINTLSSFPDMFHVTATATGGTLSKAMIISNGASGSLTDARLSASSASDENDGIVIYAIPASQPFVMNRVVIEATGGTDNYAINNSNASFDLRNVTASASTGNSYGLYSDAPNAIMRISNSQLEGGTAGYHNGYTTYDLIINHSTLISGTKSLYSFGSASVWVGASQLDGTVDYAGSETITCAESYDGSYVALDTDCVGPGSLLPSTPQDATTEPPPLPTPGE